MYVRAPSSISLFLSSVCLCHSFTLFRQTARLWRARIHTFQHWSIKMLSKRWERKLYSSRSKRAEYYHCYLYTPDIGFTSKVLRIWNCWWGRARPHALSTRASEWARNVLRWKNESRLLLTLSISQTTLLLHTFQLCLDSLKTTLKNWCSLFFFLLIPTFCLLLFFCWDKKKLYSIVKT